MFLLKGVYHEWLAAAIGRNGKAALEFLEKSYSKEIAADDDKTIKLAIRALMEVGQGKNLEVAIMRPKMPIRTLDSEALNAYISEIDKEKAEAESKKKMK